MKKIGKLFLWLAAFSLTVLILVFASRHLGVDLRDVYSLLVGAGRGMGATEPTEASNGAKVGLGFISALPIFLGFSLSKSHITRARDYVFLWIGSLVALYGPLLFISKIWRMFEVNGFWEIAGAYIWAVFAVFIGANISFVWTKISQWRSAT